MSEASKPAASSRVFISYRREETAYPAGWLYDRLDDRFGDAQVFKDVDSIPLGDDFVEAITRAVGSCDVLLALIGDRWLTASDERGARRLDDPHDFVRLEIEAALSRNVRVIPVLVDGARMPRADELPVSMGSLVRRQALELSPSSFESDTNRLVKVLATTLAEVRAAQQAEPVRADRGSAPGHDLAATATATATGSGDEPGATPADPGVGMPRPDPGDGGSSTAPPRRRALGPIIGIAAVAVAVIAAVVAVIAIAGGDDDAADEPSGGGFVVDTAPDTSRDGLEVSGLDVSAPNGGAVGDTVTVRYSLKNVTDEPIQFAATFVGARDEADTNWDTEDVNEDVVLEPDDSVEASGAVLVRSAGAWEVWPCYTLVGGQQCPDKWKVTSFLAE